MAGHPEGTFHKALQMIKRIDKSQNPEFNIEKVHFFPLGGIKQVSDFVNEI